MNENRGQLIEMAKLFQEVQQYEDMLGYVKKIVINYDTDLQYKKEHGRVLIDERSLFQQAFFMLLSDKRIALSKIREIKQDEESQCNFKNQKLIIKLKMEIENEIIQNCKEGIQLIDEYLLKRLLKLNDYNIEQKVFYLKLKADFNRYMCEVYQDSCSGICDKEYKQLVDDTFQQYQKAHDIAIVELKSTNVVRVSLGYNFSKFYYYELNQIQEDVQLKKYVFDEAIANIEGCAASEGYYDDIIPIMQEIRDGITLSVYEMEQNQIN